MFDKFAYQISPLKRAMYQTVATHQEIPMVRTNDVKLGKIRGGKKQPEQ